MRKIISVLVLLILIAGCSKETGQEPINEQEENNGPPTVQLKTGDTVYPTEQGSYCWRNENSADCLSLGLPAEILENIKPIKVSSKQTITLLMKRQPSQQLLTIESSETNQIDKITLNETNQFKAPDIDGIYILNYYAIWEKDSSGTSGDSSYVFKIQVQ